MQGSWRQTLCRELRKYAFYLLMLTIARKSGAATDALAGRNAARRALREEMSWTVKPRRMP